MKPSQPFDAAQHPGTALPWAVVTRSCMAIMALALTTPSAAHHSFAMFDQSRTVALHGTVKDFRWTNPHVFIQVLAANEAGADEEWSIEMTSPEHLRRCCEWKPHTLKAGDKVTLLIHPLRDSVRGGQFLSGTGPSGEALRSNAGESGGAHGR